MALSTYLASALAAWSNDTQTAFPAVPASLHLALFGGDPKADESGAAELTGAGYQRTQFEFVSSQNGTASILLQNKDAIIFPVATGDLGSVTHYGVYDNTAGGNLLYFGNFNAAATWLNTTTFTIPINQLQLDIITQIAQVTPFVT